MATFSVQFRQDRTVILLHFHCQHFDTTGVSHAMTTHRFCIMFVTLVDCYNNGYCTHTHTQRGRGRRWGERSCVCLCVCMCVCVCLCVRVWLCVYSLPCASCANLMDSTVWACTPSSAATTSTTMSVTCAPRARIDVKAAWPGVSRKVTRWPLDKDTTENKVK